MSTADRYAELTEASLAFQAALAKIGVATIAEAIKLWNRMGPSQRKDAAAQWLDEATQMVMTQRATTREVARAYYRLGRALTTGTTVADPYNPEPEYITLDDLRDQFGMLTIGEAPARAPGGPSAADPTEDTRNDSAALREAPRGRSEPAPPIDDLDRILVEEIEGLREEEERLDRIAEEQLREVLENLGPANLDRKLSEIDTTAPADEVDRLRDEADAQVAARQAAAAERVALDGARSELHTLMDRDTRAIGWARVSRTGTPCGWCAMLISRGAVYKSKASASAQADGDTYHDNCHCYAIPMFTDEQYDSSPEFDLNRKYAEEWPKVTAGLSGKSAISAWRRFIRTEQA